MYARQLGTVSIDVGQYRGTAQSSERRRYVAFIYSLSRATIPSKNRFYIGEVVYRGEAHRGEHEPILARDLFYAVQTRLAANSVARQVRLRPPFAGVPLKTQAILLHLVKNGQSDRQSTRSNAGVKRLKVQTFRDGVELMVQFMLPKNSKITAGKTWPRSAGARNPREFRVYRWNPDDANNPRMDTYFVDLDDCAPMVLDALIWIKNVIDPTLSGL